MWSKKPRKTDKINTLIGEDALLEGNVRFSGGLHVDGRINGNITAKEDEPGASISVSEKGIVNGEIRAPFISLNGVVHGNIYAAERIEVAAKCRVNGNIRYQFLEMAVGAEVNGKLIRLDTARTEEAAQAESGNVDAVESKV